MAPDARGGRRRTRRLARRLLPALGVGLLGLALAPFAAERCAREPAPPAVAAPAPLAPPEPEPVTAAPAPPPEGEVPEPIRRYLERTQYPPTSGRLTAEHDALLYPNRRYERLRPILDTVGGDPEDVVSLVLTADRYYYTDEDVAKLRLEAERGGEPADLAILEASAVREGRTGAEGEPEAVVFEPGGGGLVATLPLDVFADHHGPVLVSVRAAYAPGRTHEEELRFFVTPTSRIPARFTGEMEDSVRNGSLLLEVGIEVERPGFFRFDANLTTVDGTPVAFAIFKGELSRSDRVVPYEVFGKVLRDAGRSGPYVVSELRGYRFIDGSYPDRERLPDNTLRFVTDPHPLAAFSDGVYTSEHKRRMLKLMQADIESGLGVDVPPLPGADAAASPTAAPAQTAPEGGARPGR